MDTSSSPPPIGMLNCGFTVFPLLTGTAVPGFRLFQPYLEMLSQDGTWAKQVLLTLSHSPSFVVILIC